MEEVNKVSSMSKSPPKMKPNDDDVVKKAIPVLDFSRDDRALLVREIFDASQEFGFFQLINHGVASELLEEIIKVFKEFHGMSIEDKMRECSKHPSMILHRTSNIDGYMNEPLQSWKDTLAFNCHPLENYQPYWPRNPSNYREVVGAYCVAIRKLSMEILEVISEGLGVEKEWLMGELSDPKLVSHHYPLCPNPSFMALKKHCDPSLITILLQQMNGLQSIIDGQWVDVHPIQGALVVNIGHVLQVISNGKLKAGEHQVVMNTTTSRNSLVYQVYPKDDVIIEPTKCLTNEVNNPPHYRSIKFGEFKKSYMEMGGDSEAIKQYLSPDYDHQS